MPHKLVDREFRKEVGERLPGLGSDYRLWRILEYILFGTWVDDETGLLVLSAKQTAYLVGEECKWLNHRFNQQVLLNEFTAQVFPVATVGVEFGSFFGPDRAGRLDAQIPQWLEQIAASERRKTGGDLVEFGTGAPWTRQLQAQNAKSMRMQAVEAMKSSPCVETTRLLEHLNSLPSNSFASIRERIAGAHELVDEVGRDTERQHNLLKAVEQYCQPLYQPVSGSVRVYSLNESFLRLKREVREHLTEGWTKADLRSAQLAIVATKWKCLQLSRHLQEGKSIWPELLSSLGLSVDDEQKSLVKELLYALVFGMREQNLRALAARQWPQVVDPWERLKKNRLLREVLHARRLAFRQIRTDGGATDAFGRMLPLASRGRSHGAYQPDNAKSLLAQVAQSWELRLMLPILDLAEEHRGASGFRIMMWLHDGVAIHVPDARRRQSWRKRISEAVDANSMALGIPTSLEWS
ncbi:MAG: hypothetical protein KF743_12380 [Fimbriimonadaceae bacterium]|nr:hypothetical protein [Fimbriimonadaceae bacterium]